MNRMEAIRCDDCGSIWLSFIARDVMQLSKRCLRCDSEKLNHVAAAPAAVQIRTDPARPEAAAQAA